MMRRVLSLFTFLVMILFTGCGTGHTSIMMSPRTTKQFTSVALVQGKSPSMVPAGFDQLFAEYLSKKLYEQDSTVPGKKIVYFKKGNELKIIYKFTLFDPPSQTKSVIGGLLIVGAIGGYGDGEFVVEAKFTDSSGKELAKIQSYQTVKAMVGGGPDPYALQRASNDIAQYAIKNFSSKSSQ